MNLETNIKKLRGCFYKVVICDLLVLLFAIHFISTKNWIFIVVMLLPISMCTWSVCKCYSNYKKIKSLGSK